MRFNVKRKPFDDVRVRKPCHGPGQEGHQHKITPPVRRRPTRWFPRQSRLHPPQGPRVQSGGSAPLCEAAIPMTGFPRVSLL